MRVWLTRKQGRELIGGGFLLILALAFVMWLGMIIHAKFTHQKPPWKQERERHLGTPMSRAYRGVGATLPKASPEQRARNQQDLPWVIGYFVATIALTGAGAGLTWAETRDGALTLVVGIGAYVFVFVVTFPILAIRESRRASRQ